MIRLQVFVEGQSEEGFVRDVLGPSLSSSRKIFAVARLFKVRGKRQGGLTSYAKLKYDLTCSMRADRNREVRFTTMFDLRDMGNDFPGYSHCRRESDPISRAECLEKRFAEDLDDERLIPYVQVHEFEALLFAQPGKFSLVYPTRSNEVKQLEQIRSQASSPEHINDGPQTAPSKLIEGIFPGYPKATYGPQVAKYIGLNVLRRECRHFGDWVSRLERLA